MGLFGCEKSKKIKEKESENLEKIVGKVVEKKEITRGILDEKTTSYVLSKEDKNIYCAFLGHYKDSPKKGDLVEVHLTDKSCGTNFWNKRNKLEKGYFEFEEGTIPYKEIKRYKILKSS
ncbi:hypothetical protein KAJ87_00810 [Candidatus Pacearchaeota archaeon]|nr:hypothetical protein [Candidatus Pacearchaeota archaeon]